MTLAAWPTYDSYKDSGVEWLEKVPAHWEVWKASHAFENIGSGTTPDTGRVAYYEGDISWLQTGDLTDGSVKVTNKTISPLAIREYPTLKVYPAGSLVMAMYGATIRRTLRLDDGQILFTGLAIGYADSDAAVNQWAVPRVPIEDVIDWQGF